MEKEKKKISCSYAVLVIILFAALAFVVDYAVIERKMNKCNCPKCEVTTNNEEKDEPITNNENSNEHVNENSEKMKYDYKDVAGHYRYSDSDGSTDFYFYENGTVIYYYEDYYLKSQGYRGGSGGYLGSFFINHNKIESSILFEYYDEAGKIYYKPGHAAGGGNEFDIIDINNLFLTGGSNETIQRINDEFFNADKYIEKIVNSEIIYGAMLNSGEPRS